MKYEVVPNSCRVCLKRNKKVRSIYQPFDEGDLPPLEMLRLIVGCALKEEHHHAAPKSICKSCELSLNLAWQFRTLALKSQRIVEIYCSNARDAKESSTMVNVKQESDEDEDRFVELNESLEEVYMREEHLSGGKELKIEAVELAAAYTDGEDELTEYLEEEEEDEESYVDPDTCPEEEEEEEKMNIDETQLQTDCSEYEVVELPRDHGSIISSAPTTKSELRLKATPEEDDRVIAELRKELETLEDMLESTLPNSTSTKSATSTMSRSKLDVGDDESAMSLGKSRRGRKPKCGTAGAVSSVSSVVTLKMVTTKRSTAKKVCEESGHICDVCGNIYEKRGRMMEHRRRHDKELRFACELCDQRFHLREKLRKHMFSHSGGKPFKCSFCSCSFFYESVRKAHEAVHNGHKPYVCEECNKAFAYSHTLKKHKLIHADIKLYHCKYCDKDFRLLHHMKQHEETKIHQNQKRAWEVAAARVGTKV